jgi:hypothetical protein
LWVLTTPSTHKTTHKNFQVNIDALLQMLISIVADLMNIAFHLN